MPIKVTCQCGRQMMVGDERAGRSVACPKCGARVNVPGERREPPQPVAPAAKQATPELAETEPWTPTAVVAPPPPPPAPVPSPPIPVPPTTPVLSSPAPNELDESYLIETIPPAPIAETEPPRPVVTESSPPLPEPVSEFLPPPPPSAAPPAPKPPLPPAKTRPGYQADPEKLTAAYVLATLVACLGFVSVLPGVYDVVRHLSDLDSEPIGRWTYVLFFLGLLHFAYAIYLGQVPDWSAAWVLTGATLVQGAFYAALLTALFLAGGQSEMVESLDLGPYVDNGRARAWCFVMVCLTGMAAYFCGSVSIRWRRAFVLIRDAHR